MRFLFGDSTPAPIDLDYLQLLRDVVDAAVEVLTASDRIREHTEEVTERARHTDAQLDRIRSLSRRLTRSLEVDDEEELGLLAGRIRDLAGTEIGDAVARLRTALTRFREEANASIARERIACADAIEELLLARELPGTHGALELTLDEHAGYEAHLYTTSEVDLNATCELSIPDGDVFEQALRVRDVVRRLKVRVPARGRILGRSRLARRRLDAMFVTAVVHSADGTDVELRRGPNRLSRGLDIRIRAERAAVRVVPVGDPDQPPLAAHDADGEDAERLRELAEELVDRAVPLADRRRRAVKATFEGLPLAELDEPTRPILALIRSIAPTIREIARRSPSSAELVLDRVEAGETTRLSLPRAELDRAIRRAPERLRHVFYPLGLAASQPVPPPIPSRQRSSTEIDRGWDEEPSAVPPAPTRSRGRAERAGSTPP